MRLSFMISSRRSRVWPPQNPSAQSASPSSCRAPVSAACTAITKTAATPTDTPAQRLSAPRASAAPPVANPTKGQAQTPAGRGRVKGTGIRLRRPNAATMSRAKSGKWSRIGWLMSVPVWSWGCSRASQVGRDLQGLCHARLLLACRICPALARGPRCRCRRPSGRCGA